MKKYLPPFEAILCFVFAATILAFARAQSSSVDTTKLFITESTNQAFLIQTYNRILVGTWFEMRNDEVKSGTSITVADYPVFAPEKVRVIVKTEPTITRKNDGTWEISFKEVRP